MIPPSALVDKLCLYLINNVNELGQSAIFEYNQLSQHIQGFVKNNILFVPWVAKENPDHNKEKNKFLSPPPKKNLSPN